MRRLITACGVAACAWLLSGAVVTHAQWLNYKTPGVPRNANGSPKLDASTPRGFDGHSDLSGVWMHDLTPIEELRRLFPDYIDGEITNELPGMEARNIHKVRAQRPRRLPRRQVSRPAETTKVFDERLATHRPRACA